MVAGLHVELRRPARCLGADDPTEDDGFGQRVAAEPVGAVHPARALADRVKPFDVGGVGLGVDPDAAHRVLRGGGDLHRGARDVEHGQVEELPVHARQSPQHQVALEVRDVE